jgi:enoyl-CoA hydratase/carnithine racemase
VTQAGSELLLNERRGDVAVLTLNRPEVRNALHPDQLGEMREILAALAEDQSLKLLAITGAGEKSFSAGFDIRVLQSAPPGARPSRILFEVTAALVDFPVPTIAVVRGHCVGAGLDLALSCDHRIAAPGARFALPAAKLGTVYEPRSLGRMQATLGLAASKRLVVCGQTLGVEEALGVGLVDRIVEPENLDDAIAGWVDSPPATARAHKRILEALAQGPPRPREFWEPLEALRERSVDSASRRDALDAFVGKDREEEG